jgi:hypothetical protein
MFVMPNQRSDDRSTQKGNKGNESRAPGSTKRTGWSNRLKEQCYRKPGTAKAGASKDNQQGQRDLCLIVITMDSKAICPIMTASKASKKKLLQGIIHLMMMTRTQNNQNTKLQTGIRTQPAA